MTFYQACVKLEVQMIVFLVNGETLQQEFIDIADGAENWNYYRSRRV